MNAARFQVRLSGEKADNAEAVGEALSAIGGLFRELGIGVRVAAMGWVCDGCDTARPEDHSDWVHERSLETELYGEDGIRTGQIGHLNDAVRIQAERAERAEERLRAVEQAARNVDRAHESFRSSLPYQPPEAIYALYREKLALPLDALRAVLPEQEDE